MVDKKKREKVMKIVWIAVVIIIVGAMVLAMGVNLMPTIPNQG